MFGPPCSLSFLFLVRSGPFAKSAFEPRVKKRPMYSDEPIYRIRQNLHFSSERMRSLLRKIDRFLAG